MDETENKSTETKSEAEAETAERVRFLYDRSQFYREILADGVFGGVTPGADIHLSFYNQHISDFVEQIFEVNSDRTLGREIKRVHTGGYADGSEQVIKREIEVGVTMSAATAIGLIRWLTAQVKEAHKRLEIEEVQEDGNAS